MQICHILTWFTSAVYKIDSQILCYLALYINEHTILNRVLKTLERYSYFSNVTILWCTNKHGKNVTYMSFCLVTFILYNALTIDMSTYPLKM